MSENPRPAFPASELPEAPADQKLLGLYVQRQEGLFLQRIRVPGGRLTPAQWFAIADAADLVGARDALHLTTRQCVEIHGLTAEKIPTLQSLLADAGLSTFGAAGDTVRTMTVDPEAGLVPGSWDLLPLAEAITTAVEAIPGIWGLPRKFKVSLSASSTARMRPWTSDLGLIAAEDGTLTAIVAGSLGPTPATGIHFAEHLSGVEAVALAVAAVRLHAAAGDRENRRVARLRHVRERMGDAAFRQRLAVLFAAERTVERPSVAPLSAGPTADWPTHVRLGVPHGDVPLEALRALVERVMLAGGRLRIGVEHDLHVFGLEVESLPEAVRAWATSGRLVSCPGADLCSKAATPTRGAADALAPIARRNPELLFAISGCPNSCSHAAIADIGLIGRMKRVGGERMVHYVIHTGGDLGAGPALAQPFDEPVPQSLLAERVQELLGE